MLEFIRGLIVQSFLVVCLGLLMAPAAWAEAPAPQGDALAKWAGVIVAADWRAAGGKRTEAFDNARRDVAGAFVSAGMNEAHIIQFSAQPPENDPTPTREPSVAGLKAAMNTLIPLAGEGCLFYFTSHGNKRGITMGDDLLSPAELSKILSGSCGRRPTVVMISACHSGVFIKELEAPHRLVMTAARPDRTSFGCGESDRYPYFDACVLETMPTARTFRELTSGVTQCVARKEKAQGFPPSEPQLAIGAEFAARIDGLAFANR